MDCVSGCVFSTLYVKIERGERGRKRDKGATSSNRTASQQLALKFRKYAFWFASSSVSFFRRKRSSLLYARSVGRPSNVSLNIYGICVVRVYIVRV